MHQLQHGIGCDHSVSKNHNCITQADWRECHRQVVAQRLLLDYGACLVDLNSSVFLQTHINIKNYPRCQIFMSMDVWKSRHHRETHQARWHFGSASRGSRSSIKTVECGTDALCLSHVGQVGHSSVQVLPDYFQAPAVPKASEFNWGRPISWNSKISIQAIRYVVSTRRKTSTGL